MRASLLATALLLAGLGSGPAAAQGMPSSNINSINNSLAAQSQMRAFQQQQTTDFNTLNMQGQRNVLFQPQPDYYAVPGRAFHHSGARGQRLHSGAGRSIGTSICRGC
ncbi:hypothetical protein [Methylobacterium nigriterrae]|uniref:hypothetical protein n=1 Tax=Methylobacterium nigriterrae TaxID=3127512 RepID=UPI003013A760